MALVKRGGVWYFRKMINGRVFRESTGFADKKAAERRANGIELNIRANVHGAACERREIRHARVSGRRAIRLKPEWIDP
jgi:hypothetical protein